MSKILLLCTDLSEIERKSKSEYDFNPNGLAEIQKYKPSTFDEVYISCSEEIPWKDIWMVMKDKSLLRIKRDLRFNFLIDSVQMNEFFIPLKEKKNWNIFIRIVTLKPEITSPQTISNLMQSSQDINHLFVNKGGNPQICGIVLSEHKISGKKLGSGAEGAVFHIPSWKSDVAIKEIKNAVLKTFFNAPIEGVYSSEILTEVLSGSLVTELLSGTKKEGYLLHVQRYTGFFSCLNQNSNYDFYIVGELADGDFGNYLLQTMDLKELKVLIWQTLFSLYALNVLKFFHQDCSTRNIFYKILKPGDEFLGNDIYSSSYFTYRLRGKEWTLPNVGKIVKIADFGYMSHLSEPMVFVPQTPPGYRIGNEKKGAYDISYFMISLFHFVEKKSPKFDISPLLAEWLVLLGKDPNIRTSDMLVSNGIINKTYRPTELAEKWDPLVLLNGSFFSDVVMK
jgi:hypothetical protein